MGRKRNPDARRYNKHGLGGAPTYRSWYTMIQRCTNPKDVGWETYGGRGIKVCERWLVIENFVSDMGIRPNGMTLDRVDVQGDYCKENCRWASMAEQNQNRRNNSFTVEILDAVKEDIKNGLSQRKISKKYGVSQSNISRANRGLIWKNYFVQQE